MSAKLYLPLLLTVFCGGLLFEAGGSKLNRKTSFWRRSDQTESLVVSRSGKSIDKATESSIDPESLCIKHTLLSLEDPKASKYGSMRGWMTQNDWGEEWRKINSTEFRFVKIGVDGFPCAVEGCCKHSMTLRLGGSDWFVVQNVINEYASFLKTLLPWQPKAILEGGGNIGVASSLFAFLYPEAKIIVLEPEPENCKLLKKNTKAFKNVVVECVGLWDREGISVALYKGGDNQAWAWRLKEVPAGTPDAVNTTSVPALLKKYGLAKFDMAKIDIEGAEFNVFKPEADTQWVDDTQVMMLELHGEYGNPQSLRVDFTARGFNTEKSGEYDTFTRPAVQRLSSHKRHVH